MSVQTPDLSAFNVDVADGAKDLRDPYALGLATFARILRKRQDEKAAVGDQGDLNASAAFATAGLIHSVSFEDFCQAAREELSEARNQSDEPKYPPEQVEEILASHGVLSIARTAPLCTGDECELPDDYGTSEKLAQVAIPKFRFGFYEYFLERPVETGDKDSRRRS